MSSTRLARVLALLALAPLASCHCNSKLKSTSACASETGVQADNPAVCAGPADCSDHYGCVAPKDAPTLTCCLFEDRACATEKDCCPGQQCPADRKKCFDKFLTCTTDVDCGNTDGTGDLFCQPWKDSYGTSNRCVFKPCGALGACPNGQSCFQGQCLATLPCGGTCPAGSACVPEAAVGGWCQQYACPASCAPGFIPTFTDTTHIWDTCNLATESCVCAQLPPLRSNDLGRFSALAADNTANQMTVSMYDGQYGDLVVNKYDATGALLKQQYVDGVPDSGTVVYGPSGPRGGITDPGTDVGRYSHVAVSGQFAYVSYYDNTNGALKLAVRQADGQSWQVMQVDGANADVGLYTSVAVDSDGLPGISYFQRGGKAGFNAAQCPAPVPTGPVAFITALKFARATKTNPQSAADFNITTIACQSRPVPACYQCSGVCADPGTGPSCYQAATGCTGCDPNTDTCVKVGSTNKCGKNYNPALLADTPDGVGLFTSLAFQGKSAFIAYQQRTAGSGMLYGVSVNASNTAGAAVLLDGSDDTGYFPNLQIDPANGQVAVSYQDWATKALKFYYAAGLKTGVTAEIIDTGAGAPGSGVMAYVGASSTIAYAPNGDLYVAYQDTTNNNLNLALRKPTWTLLNPLHTAGAVGFFANGSFLGPNLFVSSAQIHARNIAGAPTVDNSLVLDKYTPP